MAARHPIQDIRDAVCLDAYNDGWTTEELARVIGKSVKTIRRWIQDARNNPDAPDLELWMSGAGKQCSHHRPIVRGMPVLCLDCLARASTREEVDAASGIPTHPALRRGRISKDSKPDTDLSAGEIAASVQPTGPGKFRPRLKAPKP
jgi:transcriptional regulator with XRE-family HTH domain